MAMYKNIPIKTVESNSEQHYNHDQMLSMIHRLINERDVLWRENEYLKAKLNESLLMETIDEMKKERELLLKLLVNLTAKDNSNGNHQPHHHLQREDQTQYQTYYSEENNSNGYSHELVPPPPYQTYNNTPNGKTMHNNSPPPPRKHPAHSRQHQAPLPHRDFSNTLVTEAKPTRRSHRTRTSQAESQQTQPAAVYRVEGTKECLMNPDELSSVFAHVKHSHPNKKIVVYKTSTTPQTHEFHQLVDEMCIKHGVELKHSQNSPFQQYRSQSLQDLTSSSTTNQLTPREFDFQFQPIDKQEHSRVTYVKK